MADRPGDPDAAEVLRTLDAFHCVPDHSARAALDRIARRLSEAEQRAAHELAEAERLGRKWSEAEGRLELLDHYRHARNDALDALRALSSAATVVWHQASVGDGLVDLDALNALADAQASARALTTKAAERGGGTVRLMGKRYSVAVDFDGVLHSYTSPWVAAHVIPDPPVDGAIAWLDLIGEDFDIVIFTTRAKTWRGRRAVRRWLYEEAYYLRDHNIRITARKPPCLIYLDDRAIRFEGPGTFPTKDEIHAARPWNKRVRV